MSATDWESWERGESRCPYCVGYTMEDFEAICDCSRFSWETTGRGLAIQVVGSDSPPVPVMPFTFEGGRGA